MKHPQDEHEVPVHLLEDVHVARHEDKVDEDVILPRRYITGGVLLDLVADHVGDLIATVPEGRRVLVAVPECGGEGAGEFPLAFLG